MQKPDQHLIESMKSLMNKDPENYLEDYMYLTYDYAWFAAESGKYDMASDLLRESLCALIQMKKVIPEDCLEEEELQDMALGYHDLMIETAEAGYFDLAMEIREWIQKMLDTYDTKIKNK